MFHRASSKLEDARSNLDSMKTAKDAVQFKAGFNSFLSNCRAVTYALQKAGAHVHGLDKWYGFKQDQMKKDDLLRFVHESRNEDFHEGAHRLCFGTYIRSLSFDSVGLPPHSGADLLFGTDGPFWLIHQGTSKEQRIPITQGSDHVIQVTIRNPPKTHRGAVLPAQDQEPVSLCSIVVDYMAELVHEARTTFSHRTAAELGR